MCGMKCIIVLFTWTEIEVLFKNVGAACFGNGLNIECRENADRRNRTESIKYIYIYYIRVEGIECHVVPGVLAETL